ncbi:MAG: hypothetical protein ABFC54_07805 [Thermoguttaceae bacterium]
MTATWQRRGGMAAMVFLGVAATVLAGDYNPSDPTVEMFSAMQRGDIAVKFIPKDSTQARVLIENKTDRPLNVKLPDAFAGVPVLAQSGRSGRSGGSSRDSSSGNQSSGGGMGGMGGGMGMFNIAPEKVGQLKVTTVCLEHGKREPNERMAYEIRPLESVTSKPGVRELCQLLGNGKISQRAAQAAAWHLNNDMSWQQLAAKQLRFTNGTSRSYFTADELHGGMELCSAAIRLAKENENASKVKPQADQPASEAPIVEESLKTLRHRKARPNSD